MSFRIGQATKQRKNQGQEKSRCRRFLCFGHQVAKSKKEGAAKQRGRLIVHSKSTDKEKPTQTVQSIVAYVEPNPEKRIKTRERKSKSRWTPTVRSIVSSVKGDATKQKKGKEK